MFAKPWNRPMAHFSEHIPIVKWHMTVIYFVKDLSRLKCSACISFGGWSNCCINPYFLHLLVHLQVKLILNIILVGKKVKVVGSKYVFLHLTQHFINMWFPPPKKSIGYQNCYIKYSFWICFLSDNEVPQ